MRSPLITGFFTACGIGTFIVALCLFTLTQLIHISLDTYISLPILLTLCWLVTTVSCIHYVINATTEKKAIIESLLSYALINSLVITTILHFTLKILPSEDTRLLSLSDIYLAFFASLVTIKIIVHQRSLYAFFDGRPDTENISTRSTYLVIILILALALALRLYKLDHLTPYIDEFYHLTGGKRLFLEGTFNYPRAPFLTWLIGSLFKLYGNTSLYIARLPSAIIGSITVIPLYFLARKIHPYIGLLSALIFAILPVCIGMSRSIREYPFFFFIFIIFINWFIWTIDILQENWRNKKGIINLALLLSLPGIYFLFLDVSNFIIQLYITLFVIFSVFQVFRLLKKQYLSYSKIIDFLKMHYTRVLIILVAIFSILALLVSRVSWVISFSVPKNLLHFEKINYFDAIFNPSFNPWGESLMWFSRSNYPMLFILLIFLIPILVLRKNRVLLSYAASFIFILTTFLYFINRYYAIRYISYAFPFYIVIFGCSIYLLLKLAVLFPKKNNRIVYSVFICLLLSSIFSITPAIEGLKNEQVASIDPKTEMLGYDYPDLFKKLNELGFVDGDYLITSEGLREALTYYFNRYSFISDPKQYPDMRIEYTGNSQPVYDYSTIMSYYTSMPYYSRPCTDQVCDINEKQRIENMINEQPHGWIIIDKDRNRNWNTQGFPIQDFYNDRKLVSYKGSTDGYRGFDIYNW